MEDRASLRYALKDAYAVFAVTNFLDTMDTVAETRQGKNVADIAKVGSITVKVDYILKFSCFYRN